jgi:hypothetical protein
MKAELLTSIPPAGVWEERRYDVSGGHNVWVLMTTKDEQQWVGVFGPGRGSPFSAALPLMVDGEVVILVIAGGQGYVVDSNGQLLRRTPWDLAYAAVAAPSHDRVIIASTTEIWAAGANDDRYATRYPSPWFNRDPVIFEHRVAVDGINFDPPQAERVTGKLWDMDGWYSFRLSLDSLALEVGEMLTTEQDGFAATRDRGGYPLFEQDRAWFMSLQC